MALPHLSGPWPLIQFRNPFISQTVGLLGRVISPSQNLYLNTGQHKQDKRIHTPNINALSGVRTHDNSVRASEDSSRLRPRGYSDRQILALRQYKYQGHHLQLWLRRSLKSSTGNRQIPGEFLKQIGLCISISYHALGDITSCDNSFYSS
jgi:hypothetical protein